MSLDVKEVNWSNLRLLKQMGLLSSKILDKQIDQCIEYCKAV